MSQSKIVRILSYGLTLAGSLLAACQPVPPSQVASPTLVPTPLPTGEVNPAVFAVPVNGLIVNEDPPRWATFNINTLAYEFPGKDEVEVINFTYAFYGDKPLTIDVYYPPGTPADSRLPVVLFGLGYRMSEEPLRNSHFYTSWGKLVAAAGMVGVVYDTEQPDRDLEIVMASLRDNAAELHINPEKIGFFSSSSNVPTVMSYLMQKRRSNIRFSVYYYGLSLTPDHKYTEEFGESCEQRGCLVKELEDVTYVDTQLPLFVVKTEQEPIPNINEAMERFLDYVQEAGAPVIVIEYEDGRHGFDTQQHTEESAQIIAQTLDFMLENFDLATNEP